MYLLSKSDPHMTYMYVCVHVLHVPCTHDIHVMYVWPHVCMYMYMYVLISTPYV